MRKLIEACLALTLVAGLAPAAFAQEVTLDGSVMCGKCALGKTEQCQDVLVVGQGEAAKQYWIVENEVSKAFGHVCEGTKAARVKGTVSQAEGQTWITPTSMQEQVTR